MKPFSRGQRQGPPGTAPLELWGGLECTLARVGERYRDQVRETGHRERATDLDLVAGLGIRTLRYPVLWESVSPERPDRVDFSWHDRRLARLRDLGIEPIAGLVHHGSGPRYTDLLDPAFPRLLARHASRVARRYPWIRRWTPVNEPLTTARFSCLYGHWYPHRRSEAEFLRALVNQCRATLLSMRAIRRVIPDAELVQTEDLGRVFSTPALAYQAEYENDRRWLSFDLLFGRVDRDHPWRGHLLNEGIAPRELEEFLGGEGRPNLVGINHYLTTDRYLDERTRLYPEHLVGGNGTDVYADVEAVRIPHLADQVGPAARLREAWERYRAPLAITEVHHGSSRDEQLRWLSQVWREAENVRSEGVDVRAVAVWSLFGTVDWNSLLTRDIGLYEPGAFDVRGAEPRPTALASAVRQLAREGRVDHPVLDTPGWWRRPTRLYHGAAAPAGAGPLQGGHARSLLVVGPDGPTRRAFLRIAADRGLPCRLLPEGRLSRLQAAGIWAVVGMPERPYGGADLGGDRWRPEELASACRAEDLPLLLFGSIREERSGSWAEEPGSRALVVRTDRCFGPWDPDDEIAGILGALSAGRPCGPGSELIAPAYLPDLIHVALDSFLDGETGLRPLANGTVRRGELVRMLEDRTGLTAVRESGEAADADPVGGLLGETGSLMPPLASALDRFLADCAFDWRAGGAAFRIAAE